MVAGGELLSINGHGVETGVGTAAEAAGTAAAEASRLPMTAVAAAAAWRVLPASTPAARHSAARLAERDQKDGHSHSGPVVSRRGDTVRLLIAAGWREPDARPYQLPPARASSAAQSQARISGPQAKERP